MKQEYKELFELIDTNKELLPTGDYVKICHLFQQIYKNKENKENNINFSIKNANDIRNFKINLPNYKWFIDEKNFDRIENVILIQLEYLKFNIGGNDTFQLYYPAIRIIHCYIKYDDYVDYISKKTVIFNCGLIQNKKYPGIFLLVLFDVFKYDGTFDRINIKNNITNQLIKNHSRLYPRFQYEIQIPQYIVLNIKKITNKNKKYDEIKNKLISNDKVIFN